MTRYAEVKAQLQAAPRTWLVTGVAGFIGSNLLEALLKLDQRVVGLDNFATGHQRNLDEVQTLVTPEQWASFNFIQGDIRNLTDCQSAMVWSDPVIASPASVIASPTSVIASPASVIASPPSVIASPASVIASPTSVIASEARQSMHPCPVDYVLHQAALGSVPRSLADPITTNAANITGFVNMLVAARDAKVKSFTYAASSSTYGDHPGLPKFEDAIGKPLSPYAVTKVVNELYADVFARCYGFNTIGLRYFNVFGPRQDPNGAYAAVIPKWIASLIQGEPVYINGDGETSRDFCFIGNVVQANLLAATAQSVDAVNQVYNVAVGERTSLNELYAQLHRHLLPRYPHLQGTQPEHRGFRAGDVRHSLADIGKAQRLLGYAPTQRIGEGLALAMPWYVGRFETA